MSARAATWIGLALVIGVGAYAAYRYLPASPPAPTPAPAPAPAPAPKPPVKKDPKQVLSDARSAAKAVRAMSYAAAESGTGTTTYSGEVAASRADAGGWKVYAKGAMKGEDASTPFELGYDGVNVSSIREADRVMYERTILEWEDLRTFFDSQSAGAVVAWPVLAESPLGEGDEGAVFEGQQEVAGELCDVVFVPEGAAPETGARPGVRYSVGAADHLVRRIERVKADGARTLTLSELKVNEHASGATFSLAKPEGFRIRDPELARAREKPPQGPILGDPEKTRERSRQALNPGDAAPDWALTDSEGASVKLADFKGKVVVMDFWGTWCGPCVAAMPSIEKVHQKYKDRGVVVLGMNVENDPRADPAGFMRRNKYTYRLIPNSEKITKDYRITGFPTMMVIDAEGKVASVEVGFSPELETKLGEEIEKLLKN